MPPIFTKCSTVFACVIIKYARVTIDAISLTLARSRARSGSYQFTFKSENRSYCYALLGAHCSLIKPTDFRNGNCFLLNRQQLKRTKSKREMQF